MARTGHARRYMRAALAAMEAEGCVRALPDGSYMLVEGALAPEVAEAIWRLPALLEEDTRSVLQQEHSPLGWAARRITELVA